MVKHKGYTIYKINHKFHVETDDKHLQKKLKVITDSNVFNFHKDAINTINKALGQQKEPVKKMDTLRLTIKINKQIKDLYNDMTRKEKQEIKDTIIAMVKKTDKTIRLQDKTKLRKLLKEAQNTTITNRLHVYKNGDWLILPNNTDIEHKQSYLISTLIYSEEIDYLNSTLTPGELTEESITEAFERIETDLNSNEEKTNA